MDNARVLFTPAGSGNAIAAIKLLSSNPIIYTIATDVNKLAPGLYLADKSFILPRFDNLNFFDKLLELAQKEKVNVIFPCLDTILLDFSKVREKFKDKNIKIVVSNEESISITRDKWKTYKTLNKKIPFPKSFIKIDDDFDYPLLVKPRKGYGSKNIFKIDNQEDSLFYIKKIDSPIFQEYLPGKEYTIDCLVDNNGKYLFSVPRERLEIRDGISSKARIVKNDILENYAKKICDNLKICGPFFFQAMEDKNGILKITEINLRLAGTMCLSHRGGSSILENAIKLAISENIDLPEISYGLCLSRYWEELYLTKKDFNKIEKL